MTVDGDNCICMEFSSPDILYGTSLQIDESSVTVNTLGLSKRFDKDNVPEYSEALYIYSSLVSAEGLNPVESGDKISVTGICDCGGFSISFGSTGNPEAIELTDADKKVILKNIINN